jgi:protein O-GlcNAc transferase
VLTKLLKEMFQKKRRTINGAVSVGERVRLALGNEAGGRHAEAEAIYRAILEESSDSAEVTHLLASNLTAQQRHLESVVLLERVIALQPESVEAYHNLAVNLSALGKCDRAVACFNKALELKPDFAPALTNMGNTLKSAGRFKEAEIAYRRALKLIPQLAEAHYNLGTLLHIVGNSEEAIACFQKALQISPDFVGAHNNLIMLRDYIAYGTEHIEERDRWNEQHIRRRGIVPISLNVVSDPERKLRIGYVSADFRRHAAAACFGMILLNYDRALHEVTCYSNSSREDDLTAQFRASVTHWRDISSVSDESVADMIRTDRIDILVDLSGHSAGNRLLVFARKPAPVQLSAWGYPNGTGLEAMDYLLTDAVSIPPDRKAHFREQLIYLPCATGYLPPPESPLVKRVPAVESGHLTFGYFNNYVKLTNDALDLWAELLGALPDAEMVFKGQVFSDDERCRGRVLKRFSDAGVSGRRVHFIGATSQLGHMAALSDVDITLDPFPYAGGVSTLESLWMGVPVVTLNGAALVTRGTSASILTLLGLTDWIAATPRQYLDIASRKSRNIDELVALRHTLRSRLSGSPIAVPEIYVPAVEKAYRDVWRTYCDRRDLSQLSAPATSMG